MKVVLLDRDGTTICEPPDDRVDSLEKIKLFPATIEALTFLANNNFSIVLITNQAGIAEGRISESDFEPINSKVIEMLAPSGAKILKTYMCPHGPEDNCVCRKPKPTMLFQAAQEFDIDLSNTFMIGDRETDVQAGINAGTKTILVKTARIPVISDAATYQATNLLDAARYVVEHT